MRHKIVATCIGVLLVIAACSDGEPVATAPSPQVVTTSTSTTAVPVPSTTSPPPGSTTEPPSTTLPIGELELQLTEVARGFDQPVLAISPPGDSRVFVVDQPGRIWVIGDTEPELFIDLTADVIFGGERGLLGLAFHPDFATNGRFFVDYTGDQGWTRIAELQAAADGATADPATQQVILQIDQPASNHNGGMLAFGPDGYLWVATGDGGGANDRFQQGQRPDTLLAVLLRIDVDTPGEYSAPRDNPFIDGGGAAEVWAYGLRNPWRFSFDGDVLYIADVGQNEWEELDVISIAESRGGNFGWPIFEGLHCFNGPCDTSGLIEPVLEYSHSEGCSITGGYVYRGAAIPELTGHYFFADYCGGWIRSRNPQGEIREWITPGGVESVTSFGVDGDGELYVVSAGGSIFRIERA